MKFSPTYLKFEHKLRTPVDLAFGICQVATDDETVRLSDSVANLQERLGAAHNFAREHIRGK